MEVDRGLEREEEERFIKDRKKVKQVGKNEQENYDEQENGTKRSYSSIEIEIEVIRKKAAGPYA